MEAEAEASASIRSPAPVILMYHLTEYPGLTMASSSDGMNALPLPPFNKSGDFPVGVHLATLSEVRECLGAETHVGASVFWLRRMATFDGEQTAVEYWQIKRDGQLRGIVEIDLETS